MSADRELLELAAKAVGIDLQENMYEDNDYYYVVNHECVGWNPLTDDGAALRLSINLLMDVDQNSDDVTVWHTAGSKYTWLDEPIDSCRFTATRRAITRAAAEIGRAM